MSFPFFSRKIPNSAKILPVKVSAAEHNVHGLSAQHNKGEKRTKSITFHWTKQYKEGGKKKTFVEVSTQMLKQEAKELFIFFFFLFLWIEAKDF